MDLEQENKLLKEKINQLIADNLELSSRLESDYNPDKQVRKLTLQEKLELSMGNLVLKYRIPSSTIKNMYYEIMKELPEPIFVDVTFDNDRIFKAWYKVDLKKEKEEVEKGEDVVIDINKIPDDMAELQHHYDVWNVLDRLTDISVQNKKES